MFRGILDLLGNLGRIAESRDVRHYLDTHKDGAWVDLKEDSWWDEDWVYQAPKEKKLAHPVYVCVEEPTPSKYNIYWAKQIKEGCIRACPCDTYDEAEIVTDILLAEYNALGQATVVRAVIAGRSVSRV